MEQEPKLESAPKIASAEELVTLIGANPDLNRAMADMEMMDSTIHRNFIKYAKTEDLPKILELIKKNSEAIKNLGMSGSMGKLDQISIRTDLSKEMGRLLE